MNKFSYSKRIIILFSIIFITAPILIVKLNLLSGDLIYTGSVHDALGMGTVDLVELKADPGRTYTDKDGNFKLVIKRPLFLNLLDNSRSATISVFPTFEYEGGSRKVACLPEARSIFVKKLDCSTLVYPTAPTVASRVLATGIGQGLLSAPEIAARKTSLWNLLADESKNQWKDQSEFVNSLVLQEIISTKLKSQPISFSVSKTPGMINDYDYLGKVKIVGDVASVESSVTDASGKPVSNLLNLVKREKIWRYLMAETPETVNAYNSRNGWVLDKK